MPDGEGIISDEDDLYRRLAPDWVEPDGTVTSVASKLRGKPDNQISVDWGRLTSPEEMIRKGGRPEFGVGSFRAAVPRSLELECIHDPVEGNPAHSLIRGENTKAKSRLLAENVLVLIRPSKPRSHP